MTKSGWFCRIRSRGRHRVDIPIALEAANTAFLAA